MNPGGIIALVLFAAPGTSLERGTEALSDFRTDKALALLETAEGEGPYPLEDMIQLYEQLGIAYAYLDRPEDALRAFHRVLTLDRGHFLSYTLSPKVTFLFEKARGEAEDAVPTLIDVSWPRGLNTSSPIPLDVEVVSDPDELLSKARLSYRLKGDPTYDKEEFVVETPGLIHRLELPALAAGREQDSSVELYLSAFDARGNEVLRWGSRQRPREITLTHEPPEAWFQKWWVWTLVGGAVAAGTGVGVFMATREPADTISSSFEVLP